MAGTLKSGRLFFPEKEQLTAFSKEKEKQQGPESHTAIVAVWLGTVSVVVVVVVVVAALEAKGPEIWGQGEQGQELLAVFWTGPVPCVSACRA